MSRRIYQTPFTSLLLRCTMYKSFSVAKAFFFLVATGVMLLSSCTEKISGVGSGYLRDTVSSGNHTFSDSMAFVFAPVVKHTVTAGTRQFTLNTGASALFFGKVGAEGLECWAAMKMPILPD